MSHDLPPLNILPSRFYLTWSTHQCIDIWNLFVISISRDLFSQMFKKFILQLTHCTIHRKTNPFSAVHLSSSTAFCQPKMYRRHQYLINIKQDLICVHASLSDDSLLSWSLWQMSNIICNLYSWVSAERIDYKKLTYQPISQAVLIVVSAILGIL